MHWLSPVQVELELAEASCLDCWWCDEWPTRRPARRDSVLASRLAAESFLLQSLRRQQQACPVASSQMDGCVVHHNDVSGHDVSSAHGVQKEWGMRPLIVSLIVDRHHKWLILIQCSHECQSECRPISLISHRDYYLASPCTPIWHNKISKGKVALV